MFVVLALVTTLALFAAGVLVRGLVNTSQAKAAHDLDGTVATPVRVARIEQRTLLNRAEFHGFLAPFTELAISTTVPGEIVGQSVEISDDVQAGQPLFKIDDTVRKIEHEQALAVLERADSEYELAQANWHHIESLPDQTSASIEHTRAQMHYRAAKADKQRAEASVRLAAVLLERTTVKSPIDGVVSRIHSRQGEFVRQGQPLAEVIEIDRLKLLAEVEDRNVVWMEVGLPVVLTTNTLPGGQFGGTVCRIYPKALPTSRKFEVEIELPNPDRCLRPDFFMRGFITKQGGGNANAASLTILVVPREAVVKLYGQDYCYVIHSVDEGLGAASILEAVRTAVVVLPIPSDPRRYQLIGGAVEGDLVVTKGIQHLSERTTVRIAD